ncbi:tetratricopeptide repeat protein [Anaerolineales bacterium HSG25]|nr:tetratricopeptide repeat protein [Anaerolineales bacterium HSG25]
MIFISHSTQDDLFVAELRAALELRGLSMWVDSRNMRGGDLLTSSIKQAITEARGMLVIVSQHGLNSDWLYEEVDFALEQQATRGVEDFPIVPILLPDMTPSALRAIFGRQAIPLAVNIDPTAGGLEAAMPELLAALGERAPNDPQSAETVISRPLAELVLRLTDPRMVEIDQKRRATANATLTYYPPNRQEREVESVERFLLTAPLGPLEVDELSWYLEKYIQWPWAKVYQERAKRVEEALPAWGHQLYQTMSEDTATRPVWEAWQSLPKAVERRFTVYVDKQLVRGSADSAQAEANSAATLLLALPWELGHDGRSYLFLGGRPVQVRRRLPNHHKVDSVQTEPPLRVLLVSPRPEEKRAGYIDHRAIAGPVTAALNELGQLVELTLLSPPTFPALQTALQQAETHERPYHVVHFDGHGTFDKQVGLGGLCFEDPRDLHKQTERRMELVHAEQMATLMKERRIPLVMLNACQSAQSEDDPTASVAAKLLDEGVASVIAMSHSVLVETAKRFVAEFYQALAEGARVGQAMLRSQQALHADLNRGRVGHVAEFALHDWFVPVLYQEKADEPLLKRLPAEQTRREIQKSHRLRLGDLPQSYQAEGYRFVGRSRQLLALERMLYDGASHDLVGFGRANLQGLVTGSPTKDLAGFTNLQGRYAVIIGQGGEGKTTLAVELARWLVQSHRAHRAVFLSVEHLDSQTSPSRKFQTETPSRKFGTCGKVSGETLRPLIDSLGRQLLPQSGDKPYSVANYPDNQLFRRALHPILRALEDDPVVIVVDNMESLLGEQASAQAPPQPPPKGGKPVPPPFGRGLGGGLAVLPDLLTLLTTLLETAPHTRLIFTSREALPAPFADPTRQHPLRRLSKREAVQLVTQHLPAPPPADDSGSKQADGESTNDDPIETFVEAVDGHARSLVLLAPHLTEQGVQTTTMQLSHLMGLLHDQYPDDRERSLFASVALSLNRLPPALQRMALPLAMFQGEVDFDLLVGLFEQDEVWGSYVGAQASLPANQGHEGAQASLPAKRGEQAKQAGSLRSLTDHLLTHNLATAKPYNHVTLHPALAPYLLTQLTEAETAALLPAWLAGMRQLVGYMLQQRFKDTLLATTLTRLELPNLLHLLETLSGQPQAEPEQTLEVANRIEQLLAPLALPRLLRRVVQIREQVAKQAGTGLSNAQFTSQRMQIERLLQAGQLQPAYQQAEALYKTCQQAGAQVSAYNRAMSVNLLGQVLFAGGRADHALGLFQQAYQQFSTLGDNGARMAAVLLTRQGDCLRQLGRLDEAVQVYQAAIKLDEEHGRTRDVAAGKNQLATTRYVQKEYSAALAGYAEARDLFEELNEPQSVATIWHQTGMVYQDMKQYEAAETAYREALALDVQQQNRAGEASTLGQLGNLYESMGRLEESVLFLRQAADIYLDLQDKKMEGVAHSNIGIRLIKLGRYEEARRELFRAIECKKPYGHSAEPWKTYEILRRLEIAVGNSAAAQVARAEAINLYRAYRLAGGENHNSGGRLCLAFQQAMQAGQTAEMAKRLAGIVANEEYPAWYTTLADILQQILQGNRDPALAENPALDYDGAVEVGLLVAGLRGEDGG